jgi:hypothetical protein
MELAHGRVQWRALVLAVLNPRLCYWRWVAVQYKPDYETRFVFKGLNLNSVNQLIFVMVKCGALFEVRTEFINNI